MGYTHRMYSSYPDLFRMARLLNRMSQKKIAGGLKIRQQMLARYESGAGKLPVEKKRELAKKLGVHEAYLEDNTLNPWDIPTVHVRKVPYDAFVDRHRYGTAWEILDLMQNAAETELFHWLRVLYIVRKSAGIEEQEEGDKGTTRPWAIVFFDSFQNIFVFKTENGKPFLRISPSSLSWLPPRMIEVVQDNGLVSMIEKNKDRKEDYERLFTAKEDATDSNLDAGKETPSPSMRGGEKEGQGGNVKGIVLTPEEKYLIARIRERHINLIKLSKLIDVLIEE